MTICPTCCAATSHAIAPGHGSGVDVVVAVGGAGGAVGGTDVDVADAVRVGALVAVAGACVSVGWASVADEMGCAACATGVGTGVNTCGGSATVVGAGPELPQPASANRQSRATPNAARFMRRHPSTAPRASRRHRSFRSDPCMIRCPWPEKGRRMSISTAVVPATFPAYRFAGTHREIGAQYGEACRDLILLHRDLALARLGDRAGVSRDAALTRALEYRPWVQRYAPFFDDEIQGLAAAANLSLAEAYALQLRAELATPLVENDECTGFAALAEATSDGAPLVGQNADLPAFYAQIGVVAELVADDQPAILMLLPAGQVSYIGINSAGVGCFANFLTCDGWRMGLPRYFLSRLALTQNCVADALAAVRGVQRASSRNLLLLDSDGHAADLETTPTRDAQLDPVDGLLAHANHYVAPELRDEERSPAAYVANSRVRQGRMEELLHERRGQLNATVMQEILRDRACYPDTLCRQLGDADSDVITFASVIGEPSRGRLSVAVGPPNEHEYVTHTFSN